MPTGMPFKENLAGGLTRNALVAVLGILWSRTGARVEALGAGAAALGADAAAKGKAAEAEEPAPGPSLGSMSSFVEWSIWSASRTRRCSRRSRAAKSSICERALVHSFGNISEFIITDVDT